VSAEDEVRSDFNPIKSGSPLPWLLLGITLLVGVTMAIISHQRLVDEKSRTARALQANDEVMGRLRAVVAENQRLIDEQQDFQKQKVELDQRQKSMEDQLKASADEIARYKSNPRCVKK
jgi:uncharacterized membrane-anchored protein YhcB (DUF1043 family)